MGVFDFSTGFVNAIVNEEDRYRVGSLGLHYNYGVNRSLDYTVRKVAYTSHSRVGAYVRRYPWVTRRLAYDLTPPSLTGIVLFILYAGDLTWAQTTRR